MGRTTAAIRESHVCWYWIMGQYLFIIHFVVRIDHYHLYFNGYTRNGIEFSGGYIYDDIG